MVSKLKLAVTSTEGTNNGFRVPSIAYDLSFAHLLSTHDKALPFEQKLRYKKSHIRGGGEGPDPAFLLLFHKNPASRYFYIAYPNSSFV